MKRDTITFKSISSSFLSCEKDTETILRKLFIQSKPYSDILKRLLIIQSKDCLENNSEQIIKKIEDTSLVQLIEQGYIRIAPKIRMHEHEKVKSYIIISFDNFIPNQTNNPHFKDCTISFDIICHMDQWDLGDYRIRPIKIAGYIDGILNETKLSGIGTLNFVGMNELILNEDLAGYTLTYRSIHGNDDKISGEE